MTLTLQGVGLYTLALFILFATPGTVWVAIIARAMSGGFHAAWPLAIGVVVGDVVWPLVAVFGVVWVASVYGDFLTLLRWAAVAIFILMGLGLISNAGHALGEDSRLTRPGMWAGFVTGVLVILSNPKAVLFYMGVLPGFFDLSGLTWADIAVICGLSALVPLVGNLVLAMFVDRARRLISSEGALKRLNIVSGNLLIGVGFAIALT